MRYRHNRDILRAYLHAYGYPESIHSPGIQENFGDFFVQAIGFGLTTAFRGLMQTSVLAGMGLVDTGKALDCWQMAITNKDQKLLFKLYRLLCLEANLQDWQRRRTANVTND